MPSLPSSRAVGVWVRRNWFGSTFLDEGKVLLVEEFGKEYGTYFTVLSSVASGRTTRNEIDLVCENELTGAMDFYEIKRDATRFRKDRLLTKVAAFFEKNPSRHGRTENIQALSLSDM